MDVGEVLKFLAGRPVGQAVERQMHHHGAGAGAEGLELLVSSRIAGAAGQQLAEQQPRRDIGDHRAARRDRAPIGKADAAGAAR